MSSRVDDIIELFKRNAKAEGIPVDEYIKRWLNDETRSIESDSSSDSSSDVDPTRDRSA